MIRTPDQTRQAIIRALRFGGLDAFEIAAETDEAPFRVLAELRALKSGDHLVRDRLEPNRRVWTLTTRGYELAFAGDQLTIHDELGA